MYGHVCVSMCDLVWFQPPGSEHIESVNLSEIFSFGSSSGSILSIVPRCAPNVCVRHIQGVFILISKITSPLVLVIYIYIYIYILKNGCAGRFSRTKREVLCGTKIHLF